jgi:F0F1-type ATP synthase assembly protein I
MLAIGFGFYQFHWAKDILLGGASGILPNVFFAYRLFAKIYQKKGPALLKALYWALLQKLVVSVILLLIVMTQFSVNPFILLCGFLGAHWSLWLTPMLFIKQVENSKLSE